MSEPGVSAAPQNQREFVDIAEMIRRRLDDIVQRWLTKISGELGGKFDDLSALKNAVPEYLLCLSEAIRQGRVRLDQRGAEIWGKVAREHALTRVNLGFDIGQLVHEFIVLRQMIFLVAREEGLPLDSRIYGVIADLIEGAIATAVQSYADSRDFQARRVQAEHIAFLTHELRNPLTTARYGAAQLRRQLGPEHQETMAALDRGHQRLEELIDKVLLSGRLEVEKVKASPVDVLLGKLMEEAISGARGVAREKGLNLAVRYDPKAMVHADPELTRSALQNLVDNAVKYTDHGEVDVRQEDRPGEVVVHVRDNCDGISPEELKVIFEPFRRGNQRKAGTGLGLAIAKRAMEIQGGTIGGESTGERGCHFWLTLPRAGEQP